MKLYEKVAQNLSERIQNGYYPSGEKLPSIRNLSQSHNVSISTAQEAYRLLEEWGLAEVRPKSGYYVLAQKNKCTLPSTTIPEQSPFEVEQWEQVLELLCFNTRADRVSLSRAVPNLESPTLKPLFRTLSEYNRRASPDVFGYEHLRGSEKLRLQIARVMIDAGSQVHPDEIITTTGCQEALAACLRTVTQPGDVVAIDSPSYYGMMQTIKAYGLKALEIPTHPQDGMSMEALQLALEQWPIKAILITPTFNNPLGYSMPDAAKQKLLEITNSFDLPIIEDDIYGDLACHAPRPRSVKSFDTEGRVMLCSSFSKTIIPGLRVGWMAPGRYFKQVMHTKYVFSGSCAGLPQDAIAEFIAQGGYERHLRKMRLEYQRNRNAMTALIQKHLPADTRISQPSGGFLLWVELPEHINTTELSTRCREHGIGIAPGEIFTASRKYRNCMRVTCAEPINGQIEKAVETIGKLCAE